MDGLAFRPIVRERKQIEVRARLRIAGEEHDVSSVILIPHEFDGDQARHATVVVPSDDKKTFGYEMRWCSHMDAKELRSYADYYNAVAKVLEENA